MQYVGLAVFGLYLVLMVAIGVISSKYQKSTAEFWVADRSFGGFTLGVAIMASIMHGGTLLGGTGMIAAKGAITLNNLSFALGFLVVLIFMADKLRRLGGYTLPDYMGSRFESRSLQAVSALVVLVAAIVSLVAQTKTMGIIVQQMTGIPLWVALVVATLIFVFYTTVGGMRAAIWTDIVQWVFMMVGVIVLALALWKPMGGFTGMALKANAAAPGWTSLMGVGWGSMQLISWYLVWFIAYFTRIEFVTKMYSAKDEDTARYSVAWGLLLVLVFVSFTVFFGGAARVLVWTGLASPDQALPKLMATYLTPFWGAIALSGVAAAAMSTVSSLLLMSGASIAHDLLRKTWFEPKGIEKSEAFYVAISRWTTGTVGVVALIGAFYTPTLVLVLVSYAVALTGAAFAMPMLLGMTWKRVSKEAAFASTIAGFLGSGIWAVLTEVKLPWALKVHPIIPGLAASLVLIVAITLVTQPVSEKTLARFFSKEKAKSGEWAA